MKNSKPLKISKTVKMQKVSSNLKREGKSISFVPTMGALHKGHLSLVEKACSLSDITIVSIFVNPTQFGPNEDFNKYTRDLEGDMSKLSRFDVDFVFCPEPQEIYNNGFQTSVEVRELQKPLCGMTRKGHFSGVATVVTKLFNIVKPDIAVFGEKDYQQLKIIQQMVLDLNMDVEVVGMPVYREKSGLAMSSRNEYLSNNDRIKASFIHKSLTNMKEDFNGNITDAEKLITNAKLILHEAGIEDIEYMEIRDPESLELKAEVKRGDIALIAVNINGTRLIDNIRI